MVWYTDGSRVGSRPGFGVFMSSPIAYALKRDFRPTAQYSSNKCPLYWLVLGEFLRKSLYSQTDRTLSGPLFRVEEHQLNKNDMGIHLRSYRLASRNSVLIRFVT